MAKKNFYAVVIGRQIGIYDNWDACNAQVKGFNGNLFKGFVTLQEAEAYLQANCPNYCNSIPEPAATPVVAPQTVAVPQQVAVAPTPVAATTLVNYAAAAVRRPQQGGSGVNRAPQDKLVSCELADEIWGDTAPKATPVAAVPRMKPLTRPQASRSVGCQEQVAVAPVAAPAVAAAPVVASKPVAVVKPVATPAVEPVVAQAAAPVAVAPVVCKSARNFNADQEAAIEAVEGANLLFAIPGSGKTTVLVERAHRMIVKRHIPAESILIMTFSRKAADEMKERYIKDYPGAPVPEFYTIHSFCRKVLKDANRLTKTLVSDTPIFKGKRRINRRSLIKQAADRVLRSAPRAYVEGLQKELEQAGRSKTDAKTLAKLRSDIESFQKLIKYQKPWDYVPMSKREAAGWVSLTYVGYDDISTLDTGLGCLKNSYFFSNPKGYELEKMDVILQDAPAALAPVYRAYEQELDKLNLMDFDNMLMEAHRFLASNPMACRRLHDRYKYICLDEVQDTSPLQYDIVNLIAGSEGNLFMVGDDDQSIYSFRGAQPQEMLSFSEKYPQGHIYTMGINYRSGRTIVEEAEKLVRKNERRYAAKTMQAGRDASGQIHFVMAEDFLQQHKYLLEEAQKARKTGKSLAILARCNFSLLGLMVCLHVKGIPTNCPKCKELVTMMRNTGLAAICAGLNLALNPQDWDVFSQNYLTLVNSYKGELGNTYLPYNKDLLEKVKAYAQAHPKKSLWDCLSRVLLENTAYCGEKTEAMVKKIKSLSHYLVELSKETPLKAVTNLQACFDLLGESMQNKIICYGMQSVASCFEKMTDFVATTREICQIKWEPLKDDSAFPLVTLSTIHTTKGLEFDKVIIIDAVQKLMGEDVESENKPAQPPDFWFDKEEERRLFYVGVTRAKDELELLENQTLVNLSDTKDGQPKDVSNFVREMQRNMQNNKWLHLKKAI